MIELQVSQFSFCLCLNDVSCSRSLFLRILLPYIGNRHLFDQVVGEQRLIKFEFSLEASHAFSLRGPLGVHFFLSQYTFFWENLVGTL